ncbi:hypothetical protein SAMN06265365_13818 [Tistlia consotensis]|uniref:Uncharacterized protein n=1 Tax=Tistlia consotensis USBA 355 TaxID=560819 RepID=A0A1Y6CTY4_9PROT|nr:hypothetical protein SAMN05428998_13745 [Tistlia consotensis USBA 355]SNS20548.1 hypothetical protein SAMN06265365_13818 [Tistlia consotensis]
MRALLRLRSLSSSPRRRGLAVLVLTVLLAPAAARAAEPVADPAQQVRAALYHMLMAEILKTGVETATDNARWSIGKVNPYPGLKGDKVIAACVNWDKTSLDQIDWYGYAYYYDRAEPRRSGDEKHMKLLEDTAKDDCRRYEATNPCRCQVVDRNDTDALSLPEWFVRAHIRPKAAP